MNPTTNDIGKHTPPWKTPDLLRLAEASWGGACNPYALIRSLGEAIAELQPWEIAEQPAVKIVLGQIEYLCGESAGPTTAALEAYREWKAQCNPNQKPI